ncbi:MAG TPA: PQQ-dependent dehydrogenase, methanol/ethanol family [Candidatus Dormibacteraeota bacterium]|nr:PQQ-dependent dehydrogenase, methanol/ethanol family [Candidatus Dormibacteraeota bacterium]
MRAFITAVLACALVAPSSAALAQTVTGAELAAQNAASNQWLTYGHDYTNDRYSTLDQITTANVKNLTPAFVFQTGVAAPFEVTPTVVGDTMYITTAYDHVFALDARTGKMKWQYTQKLGKTIFCCGPVNRGVAVADGKVFLGTLDGKLVALDAKTGEPDWSIQAGSNDAGYSLTMEPLVYKDTVIVGGAGGEYGIRGSVTAYRISDGKEVWRFWTVGPGWQGDFSTHTPNGADLHRDIAAEKAAVGQYGDAWKTGGGEVWMTPAIDPKTHTLFVSSGNPAPDLDGSHRPGDNRWTDSIIAINLDNGTMDWAYQEIPHDVWDLDAVSPPILFDTTVDGKTVPAVGEAGKTGWFYVLDRRTGKQIRVSKAFVPQKNMFAQPTAKGTYMLPGANGGDEWSPVSYDPTLHYVFIPTLNQPMLYKVHPAPREEGALWLGSAFVAAPESTQDGSVVAVDTETGDIAWEHKVDYPMIGGCASTGGGLTFTGESNGNFDAFDSKTGDLLWQFQTGAGANAAPMVYSVDGREYVAIASGGSFQIGTQYGDALYVFALPR